MRSHITLSLPEDILHSLKKKAGKAGVTTNAFICRLIEQDLEIISEEELIQIIKRAESNYKEGKTMILKSFDDLLKSTSE